MISPLRYPGGKAKLFSFFVRVIEENALFDRCYAEPYAGGAGLALKLLGHGFVQRIELNDIDPAIFAFWRSAMNETEAFCRLLWDTPLNVEEWRRQREIYKAGVGEGQLALGFAAYFLNRTSRSGIIEGSGPIGGYAQAGEWKIDARLNKFGQTSLIQSLAKLRDYISVQNEDAMLFSDSRLKSAGHFLYLDPPYYVKGKKLYKNFYRHNDHAGIAELLERHREGCWILSYDHVPEICKLYGAFAPTIYKLNYSAGTKSVGEEVIFASDSVRIPCVPGFRLAA
ncbi:MAG TPA: DNA adenine methylase [Allosphingosinicella sp.]|jgi:DNA adenine methylase|nr:DNA adenine methylase [Allosphingosinicella sp.]